MHVHVTGDIVLFNKLSKGNCKQMGATRSEAVSCSWSPDGRYLMTATTAPRLRVDNGIKVFTYYGEQVSEKKFEMLFEAQWLPAPAGTFEDRPVSPERIKSTSGSTAAPGAPSPSKPTYR